MKRIIGVIGRIGSGKDTVSDYLADKYGYDKVSFRDVVEEITEKEGLEANRENMQMIGKKCRDLYGGDYFNKQVMKKVEESDNEKVLVKEMRTEEDVLPLKEKFGKNIKIMIVDTDGDKRFQRMMVRGRVGDPQTIEDFEKQENKEIELGFTKAIKPSDFTVDNNNSFGELYQKIDSLVKSIGYE